MRNGVLIPITRSPGMTKRQRRHLVVVQRLTPQDLQLQLFQLDHRHFALVTHLPVGKQRHHLAQLSHQAHLLLQLHLAQ